MPYLWCSESYPKETWAWRHLPPKNSGETYFRANIM